MTKVHKRGLTFWLGQRENLLDFKEAQRLTQGKRTVLSCYLGQGTAPRSQQASLGKVAVLTTEAFEIWHQRISGHLQPIPLRLASHHSTIRYPVVTYCLGHSSPTRPHMLFLSLDLPCRRGISGALLKQAQKSMMSRLSPQLGLACLPPSSQGPISPIHLSAAARSI